MRYRTLCKNKEFSRVYARGKSYVHPHMVLYVAKNRLGHTRIGLTATKKVGKAVQRNRARRVMRAALSEHLAADVGGYDIILVARAQTPKLKSTQVSRTLAKLMRAAGLPMTPAGIGVSLADTKDALLGARDIRDKYLSCSMLWDLGYLNDFVQAIEMEANQI